MVKLPVFGKLSELLTVKPLPINRDANVWYSVSKRLTLISVLLSSPEYWHENQLPKSSESNQQLPLWYLQTLLTMYVMISNVIKSIDVSPQS